MITPFAMEHCHLQNERSHASAKTRDFLSGSERSELILIGRLYGLACDALSDEELRERLMVVMVKGDRQRFVPDLSRRPSRRH